MTTAPTFKHWQLDSNSPEQTEILAAKIGANLKGGETIELISDLGGGKTSFVRGLARGSDIQALVTSPTFKLNNIYSGKKFQLHHFDFYRLNDPGLMAHVLAETAADKQSVVVVEWAEIVRGVLPDMRLTIVITATDLNSRHFKLSAPAELFYLMENVS